MSMWTLHFGALTEKLRDYCLISAHQEVLFHLYGMTQSIVVIPCQKLRFTVVCQILAGQLVIVGKFHFVIFKISITPRILASSCTSEYFRRIASCCFFHEMVARILGICLVMYTPYGMEIKIEYLCSI